ncbi:hypothetical protein PFISCL1PPCAC_14442, partial [Pristionchus fissidentatus]
LLFHIIHYSICITAITINFILFYIVVYHSPRHLKSYAIMILFLCFYEILTAFAMLLVFPRVISLDNEAIIVVYYGPCRFLHSDRFNFLIYSAVLNGITYFNIQMTACFMFRYYVLRFSSPDKRKVTAINLLIGLPTTI